VTDSSCDTIVGNRWDPPEYWFWVVIYVCLFSLFVLIALFRYLRWT